LAKRVHALPEPLVSIRHELAVPGEALHRPIFKHYIIAVDVVENRRLQHEKCTIDPPFRGLRLLREGDDLVLLKEQMPISGGWADGGNGGELAVRSMERFQLG